MGEKIQSVTDFGEPDEIPYGSEAPDRQSASGWPVYVKGRKYAHKLTMSREEMAAIEANGRLPQSVESYFLGVGASFARKKDQHIANMIQDGTLTAGNVDLFDGSFAGEADPYPAVGYDGLPFFDTAHSLKLSSTTPANHTVSAALAESTLQAALTLAESTSAVDERGRPIGNPMDTLLIPVGLEWTARLLLESALKVGSGNNDKNLLQGRLNLVVWRELSKAASTSSWWLARTSGRRALRVRDSGEPRLRVWAEERTNSVCIEAYSYFSAQVQDWRGMFAFNKAAA